MIRRQFYCDGPDCQTNQQERDAETPPDHWVTVVWHGPGEGPGLHFCSCDCVLKHGARHPPMTVIPWDDAEAAGEA